MDKQFVCKYCGHKSDKWYAYNVCCMNTIGVRYGAYGSAPLPLNRAIHRDISEIQAHQTKWIHIDNDIFDKFLSDEIREINGQMVVIPHGIAEGSVNIIHGEAGSGKTALIIYWIGLIAKHYKVIYNSTETPIYRIKGRLIDKLPYSFSNWYGTDTTDYYGLMQYLKTISPPYLLVIDSVNDMELKSGRKTFEAQLKYKVDKLINFTRKEHITLMMIMHETKDNRIKGDSNIMHDVDNIFKISKGKGYSIIETEKARDNNRGATMKYMLIAGQGMKKYIDNKEEVL